MTFNKLFAASVCLAMSVGLTAGAFAQNQPTMLTQTQVPSYKGTVNVDVIDADSGLFSKRIQSELVDRPAPQVGQTRAAIEALYGPAMSTLAPNKSYDIYTNEYDLAAGKMFRRQLSQEATRIYEVSYTMGAAKSPNDKASDVKLRVIPRVGDHRNLVSKMLGEPINMFTEHAGQRIIFEIPKSRYVFYNDVISSPFTAINAYFNTEGYLVGQEFMPSRYRGQHVMTSANRYIEFESKRQPDSKIGW